NENGQEVRKIDRYEPYDKDMYVHILIDNFNLMLPTKIEKTMLEAIGNLSKKLVTFKNRNKYIIVALQQQQDGESNSLEAVKHNNILATKAGLKENKATANDCTLFWGITNPGALQAVNTWKGYDLERFRRKYLRVLDLQLNRFGEGGIICPLFFDGAVNYYTPLPNALVNNIPNPALQPFYSQIESIESRRVVTTPQSKMFFMSSIDSIE
ncbi:MAG: hypothetical protein HUJ56_03610, partial [Erysipelotrichaceae bacterium]|nr:hypothetical protein [Erysipelotrichaceae bacterium]